MLHLRVTAPVDLTDAVLEMLSDDPAVSSLAVVRGASLRPIGDLVSADVAREAANDIVDRLRAAFTGMAPCTSSRCGPGSRGVGMTPSSEHPAAAPTLSYGPM